MRKVNFVISSRLFRVSIPVGVLTVLCAALSARADTDAPANLALVAKPSTSFASGGTAVTALNDGFTPRSSRDGSHKTYGNWPRTDTEWVQYEWSRPISTKQMDVYWWADGAGVGVPKACRVEYWDGSKFVPVNGASGLGLERNEFNTTTFDEVKTTKLRLEMDSDGELSTGLVEWKVYDSGKSPVFPPVVHAGKDRDVVLGGKTYLSGAATLLKGTNFTTKWSKASGPGKVMFENAGALETTAMFSKPGDYVLKLAAYSGKENSGSTLKVNVVEPPPKERLNVVYTKKYEIDSPLWNARAKGLIVNWIPHCIDEINDPNLREGGIANFIEAGKKLKGEPAKFHVGYPFSNAWVHQTVEAMSIALMVDPKGDPEIIAAQDKMRKTLDDWIPIILSAQEPDGYLQTRFTLGTQRDRGAVHHWDPRTRGEHEGYVAGYFIESAINHYTMTEGKDLRLYNAAKKLADCWVANIGPGKKEWFDGHQEMEQALVRFGRFVNDQEGHGRGDAYIKLARFLLDSRRGGAEYDQSHLPPIKQYEAVGHAVRAVYFYSGMADVAAETGDIDYESAVMSLWDNMVNKKYYITGGIGSGETSEGFGPNYSLRNNAYCEACSSCGFIFFQYKMNLAYHDAKYADLYEETMYNALLGSTDLDGKNFYYDNPLADSRDRYPWHVCPCCVGNIPRTLLMIPTWTYVKDDNGIYVNMFIGSKINVEKVAGTDVQMVQKTDYPWSGNISIMVNPKENRKFTVYVRIPDRKVSDLYTSVPRVRGYKSFSVNGKAVKPKIEKGYAIVTRTWAPGDHIDMELPMVPQRVTADANISADTGRMALRYGPLIYNVERADQASDMTQAISDAPLKAEWRPELLDGVMVLDGKWADGKPLTAIPNFARMNRNGETPREAAGGDSSVNYAPGSTPSASANTNATASSTSGQGQQRRFRGNREVESMVWIKE
jgi:uncharacterized protein